jgi:hypothetical protein
MGTRGFNLLKCARSDARRLNGAVDRREFFKDVKERTRLMAKAIITEHAFIFNGEPAVGVRARSLLVLRPPVREPMLPASGCDNMVQRLHTAGKGQEEMSTAAEYRKLLTKTPLGRLARRRRMGRR